MRWMVGSDKPSASASLRWSMPRRAREALSCPAVIMDSTLEVRFGIYIVTNNLFILMLQRVAVPVPKMQ
jgi:hypothetical protein